MLEETYSAVRGAFVQLRRKISVLPRVLVVREMGCRFGGVPGGVVVEIGKPGDTRIIVDGVPVMPGTRHRPSHDLPAYALLACLVARAGRIVPLSTIVAEVYGGQAPKSTVDSIVASARRRLGSALSIVEVPGFGWRFDGVGERIVIDDGAIEVGGVRLEPPGRRVFVHDNQIEFSRLTFDLLELLMKNAGRIAGWAEIRAVWDSDVVSEAALTSALKKLRGLLGDSSSVALVPGFGWRFDGVGAPILDVVGAVVSDEFRLEPSGRRVFRAGVPIRLSRLEFDVLEVLMANAGAVVPMSTFDGGEWRGNQLTPNSVVNAVGELRRKLGDLDPRARRIKSIEGVGFRFEVGSNERRASVPQRKDQNTRGFHRGGIRVETAPPAVFVNGIEVMLGSKQFGVLRTLIGRSGVVSYRELAAAVWRDTGTPVSTVQSLVDSLRARIGDTDRTKPRIELVRGVGYRFNDSTPDEAASSRGH
ncbi:winged helix-turn-helix domain-containing protein [Nocardia brasiliensis]|uniref:winged helix-turn-helix domain-containing protein n=1 Tax=Nocardia brasiliensis TaxID=37326 RepID=UPI0024566E4F|nr:winged helix-turn-helix domain-containing protein [Nocardia brasiliensis]